MRILILNGPNLNMLGKRDAELYGDLSLDKIEKLLVKEFENVSFTFFHSNNEGDLVDKIQSAGNNFEGIIINPGGYAHTSVTIHDALEECNIPKIEVHLSHLARREEFRQNLVTATGCNGYVSGFKEYSYLAGVYLLQKLLKK